MSQNNIEIHAPHLPRINIEFGNDELLGNFITVYVYEKRFEEHEGVALTLDKSGIWECDLPHVPYVLELLNQVPDPIIHNFRDVIFTRYLLETKHRQN
jgi:hypothetical protein